MRSTICAPFNLPLSTGFSLIEGVVLVSLVGIVTAFAVPRFTRLANSARASEMVALGANLRTAAELAHAQYVESGARAANATMLGKAIHLKNGYPDASKTGIGNALFETEGFATETTGDSVTFLNPDAPSPRECSVTYLAASTTATAPTVKIIRTAGC